MDLSKQLVDSFVEVTTPKKETATVTQCEGIVRKTSDGLYVVLDGSDIPTPVETTIDVINGERVTVSIKNHQAQITGNFSSPSARTDDVKEVRAQVVAAEKLIADKADVGSLQAAEARIGTLETDLTTTKNLVAEKASIESLEAVEANVGTLEANLTETNTLVAKKADITSLNAAEARIGTLETDKIDASAVAAQYAKIDFANINVAAVQKIFSDSGIIKDLVVEEGHITGELVGVTIKGDLIEAGTVKADKLVVKGEDGFFYKLNLESLGEETVEAHKELYGSQLDGSVIVAKSITADRLAVTDLVAFGATIGGFIIGSDSLHSVGKDSFDSDVGGIYLGADGSLNAGNADNYFKVYRDINDKYFVQIKGKNVSIGDSSIGGINYSSTDDVSVLEIHGNAIMLNTPWDRDTINWLEVSDVRTISVAEKNKPGGQGISSRSTIEQFTDLTHILVDNGDTVSSMMSVGLHSARMIHGSNEVRVDEQSASISSANCNIEATANDASMTYYGSAVKVNRTSASVAHGSSKFEADDDGVAMSYGDPDNSSVRIDSSGVGITADTSASDGVTLSSGNVNSIVVDPTTVSITSVNIPKFYTHNKTHVLGIGESTNGAAYGIYDHGLSTWMISYLSDDLRFYIPRVSSYYVPYYKPGDSVDFNLNCVGYSTSNGGNIVFHLHFAKPIATYNAITLTSAGGIKVYDTTNGYFNGSSSTVSVQPSRWETSLSGGGGDLRVYARFDSPSGAPARTAPVMLFGNVTVNIT